MTDQELIASLFVSDEGELWLEPEWDDGEEEVILLASRPDAKWSRVIVPEAVAAGILRLIRERDEARAALERYGEHDQRCASDGYYHSECNCGFAEAMNRHNPGALEAKEEPDGHGEPSGQ